MIFALKALLAGLIIAFSSWLAGQNPRIAGFIIALPMASLIAIAFVYFEHNSVEKTVLYAKSILVAVPVSYLFFLPFFFAKQFNMNFWMIYGSGILLLALGFFIHKYFANLFIARVHLFIYVLKLIMLLLRKRFQTYRVVFVGV